MTAVLPVRRPGAAAQLPPAGDIRPAAGIPAGTARRIRALVVRWLVRGLLGTALLAFAVLAVGPHVFGYRTLTMLTGSMSPTIDPGDVAIVTPIRTADITPGMIITYHIPVGDHALVSHRVVSVTRGANGAITVQTKGDANAANDPWTAQLQGDTGYQVRAVVPAIGTVIRLLRTPVVAQVLLYGAPTLLAGWVLLSIWRPTTTEEDQS
jgi:signal peptidase I